MNMVCSVMVIVEVRSAFSRIIIVGRYRFPFIPPSCVVEEEKRSPHELMCGPS